MFGFEPRTTMIAAYRNPVRELMERFSLARMVFAGNRGMVSEDNRNLKERFDIFFRRSCSGHGTGDRPSQFLKANPSLIRHGNTIGGLTAPRASVRWLSAVDTSPDRVPVLRDAPS